MDQNRFVSSERCRRELKNCFERFLNGFYSLWRLIVQFFSNSKQNALAKENESLRETLISQKEVFTESLRRHEPLMERIFTLEFDQETLRQENQVLMTQNTGLAKEAVFFRKLSTGESEKAKAALKAKDTEISKMREEYNMSQAEQESLKVAINLLEDQKKEINEMYTISEEEKRTLKEKLIILDDALLKDTLEWKGIMEQKTTENESMGSEISLLKEAKEQMEAERDETRKSLDELKEELEGLMETSSKYLREKEEQEKISLRLENEKDGLEIELEHKVRELDKEMSKRAGKIENQKNSLTGLQEALRQAKKESSGLFSAVKGLKEEKKDWKAAISRLEDKTRQSEGKLNEKQQTINLQRQNMKAWDACVAQTKELTDKLDKEKYELSKANSQLQGEKRELESRNQELKDAVNAAETQAVSAKAGLDTGYLFLQQLFEKHIKDLKQFLTMDAHKRDDRRRKDFVELKDIMEETESLLKSNQEMDEERSELRARAAFAEGMFEMSEIRQEKELRQQRELLQQNNETGSAARERGSGESET